MFILPLNVLIMLWIHGVSLQNLVQTGVYYDFSQIPLSVSDTIKLFSFLKLLLAVKVQVIVVVGKLLYYENHIIFIFWVEGLFYFEKYIFGCQETYLQLGLLIGTFWTCL